MARRRADLLLVERGLAPTRSKAQALILAGNVLTDADRRVEKAGEMFEILEENKADHVKAVLKI